MTIINTNFFQHYKKKDSRLSRPLTFSHRRMTGNQTFNNTFCLYIFFSIFCSLIFLTFFYGSFPIQLFYICLCMVSVINLFVYLFSCQLFLQIFPHFLVYAIGTNFLQISLSYNEYELCPRKADPLLGKLRLIV